MIVSTFSNIKDTKNPKNISASDLVKRFKVDDRYNIGKMQKLSERAYKEEKQKLPIATFGGTFAERKNSELKTASGLLTLDFDGLTNVEQTFNDLINDPTCFACFRSPSGKGVKALVKIPVVKSDEEYKAYFAYYKKHYPNLDDSGKDIARACFFCYDPYLYLREDCDTAPVQTVKKKKDTRQQKQVNHSSNDYKLLSRCCDLIRGAKEHDKHNTILKAARLAGGFVAIGVMQYEEAERILLQEADNIREDWNDNRRVIEDGLKNGMLSPVEKPLQKQQLEKELEEQENILKFGKIYYTVADKYDNLLELRANGQQKGYEVNHKELDKHMTVKMGTTTYVYGAPYSGKTQFWFEILLCLSEQHGLRHAIFSPETGTASEIFAELISMYARGDFYNTFKKQIHEDEFNKAAQFVNEHFFVVDPEINIITHKDFFAYVSEIERVYNIKIHTTTIDPFNEFHQDFSKNNGRQDLYLEDVLTEVRQNAKFYDRHNCIITHVTDQQAQIKDGKRYYPQATFREIAGGQAWSRKGMQMVSGWRP